MKSIRREVVASVLVASVVTPALLMPSAAQAASVYDNVVRVVDELMLVSPDGTQSRDVTFNWHQFISADYSSGGTICGLDETSDFAAALDHGYWAVTHYLETYPGNSQQRLQIHWTSDTLAGGFDGTFFDTYGAESYIMAPPVTGGAIISVLNNGNIVSSCIDDTGWFTSPVSSLFATSGTVTGANLSVFASTFPVTYPSGYAGEVMPSVFPDAKYVAMGDSFSSGEGNSPYEEGSDTMANVCHRSIAAYPRLVQSELDLGPTAFVACSGAIVNYIVDSYNVENVELPQIAWLSDETEVVTITIGGNDIGFGTTLVECVRSTVAQTCLDAVETATDNALDPSFSSSIEDMLLDIKLLSGENTQIIVVGYPQLFPAYEDVFGTCTWGNFVQATLSEGEVSGREITEDEIASLRGAQDSLNGAIDEAVIATGDSDIHFLDPTVAFEDHEVCGSSDDWLNGVTLHFSTSALGVASFHPNGLGQEAYADLVVTKIGEFN